MSGELDRLPGLFDPAAPAPATATDINDIDTTLIDPFPNHPYQVTDDQDMDRLTDSINLIGITTPLTLRATPDGRYQLISGHRRLHAATRNHLHTVPATVEDMDDDQAIIHMVDSNLQRTDIPISTQARALAMRHHAITHQGSRGRQPTSRNQLAQATGTSEAQVARLIRLAKLNDTILNHLDTKHLGQRAALELTELSANAQHTLAEYLTQHPDTTISTSQAKTLRHHTTLNPNLDHAAIDHTLHTVPERPQTISIPTSWIPEHIPPAESRTWVQRACQAFTSQNIPA